MTTRRMVNEFEGIKFYESLFEVETGTLMRETPNDTYYDLNEYVDKAAYRKDKALAKGISDRFAARFGHQRWPFSPSPEMVDISITDWCNVGCTYCYQDSTERGKHAPSDLVERVIKSFDVAPYQVAIGGGEPTAHPDLPSILHRARELGTVPNYTTAGHIVRDDVIEATNAVCGGVAMTFHPAQMHTFLGRYKRLRAALKVQLNVHLICDKDVVKWLDWLRLSQGQVGMLRVVLLAYYPDVGRGTYSGLMPHGVYTRELPAAIRRANESGMTLAFSEGMLPYFLSRPELGIDTRFASRSEGYFSCYVNPRGFMSDSSFRPPREEHSEESVLNGARLQKTWERDYFIRGNNSPRGRACYGCNLYERCSTPDINHYLICAYADHNRGVLPLERK